MDEDRKNAYRYILYYAMLEIRGVQWITGRPLGLLNPLELRRRVRVALRAGAVANWLHNLALFAATDFDGFRERRFWREYDDLVRRYRGGIDYRATFEQRLAERQNERQNGVTTDTNSIPPDQHRA